jgi:hypothetical protein
MNELDCNNLQQLPFANLSDREFNSLFNCSTRELDADMDLENALDNMLTNLVSDHYSIDKINDIPNAAGPKALSVFHCNVRGLPKNLTLLHFFQTGYFSSHRDKIE